MLVLCYLFQTYRLCTRPQACAYSVFVFRLGYCGLVFMNCNFVFGVGNSVFLFKLGYYVIVFILMYSAVVFNKSYYGYPAFAYVGTVHEVFLRIAIYIFSAVFLLAILWVASSLNILFLHCRPSLLFFQFL